MKASWLSVSVALLIGANTALAMDASTGTTDSSSDAMGSSSKTATPTMREKPTFLDADTNRDGYVSRNEAQQAGVSDYSYADKNADSLLDADEFDAASSDSMLSPSESSSSAMDETTETTSSDARSSMHEPNDATAMSRTR